MSQPPGLHGHPLGEKENESKEEASRETSVLRKGGH